MSNSDSSNVTATCFCGDVQLVFSIEGENLVDTFICHCTDDRKITSSMFASNFIIKNDTLKFVRGEDLITKFLKTEGIVHDHTMMSNFCKVCGSLMFRVSSGWPGKTIVRIGAVDDLELHGTKLKPRIEQFTKDRVIWMKPVEGMEQDQNSFL